MTTHASLLKRPRGRLRASGGDLAARTAIVLNPNTMAGHSHAHARARAAAPTLSLLRLSATQRLVGAGVVLAVLWLAVLATVG